MGDPRSQTAAGAAGEPWSAFQAAFARVVEEAVRQAAPASRPGKDAGAAEPPADLRKTVTDAVSAVLLETSLLDRLIEKHLKAGTQVMKKALAVSEAPADIRAAIQKELKVFLTSQELKEMIEEKFRAITVYLKTEVIPKALRDAMARAGA